METLFGLPAHPLLVHFPVVAIPAFSIAALVLMARPSTELRSAVIIAAFGLVTAVATVLTASSGEQLAELLSSGENIDRHRALGETLRLIAIVQALAVTSMVAVTSRASVSGSHPLSLVLRAVVGVSSVLAIIWVIRTGHEGASQSWGFLT